MSLQTAFARAPAGVLVIGTLLLLLGAGLIIGAVVILLGGRGLSWPLWGSLLASGPIAMYLGLNFIVGRRWAWITVNTLLVLLLVSGLLRALFGTEPVAPLAEVVASSGFLVYLMRPRVRSVFVI